MVIYKLTRTDGLEYIGITSNFKKRLNSHKNSRRFLELGIADYEILFDGSYEECFNLEEKYIEQYNTFKRGLNMTDKGKGKSNTERFSTYGYKFSEKSKQKMSISAKLRINRKTGYSHSCETKNNWSMLRKGKIWGPVKINPITLIDEWHSYTPNEEDLSKLMHSSLDQQGRVRFKNGRLYTYQAGKLALFCSIKSKELNVTKQAIKKVILNAA